LACAIPSLAFWEGPLASILADAFPSSLLIRAVASILVRASSFWEGALASTLADVFLLCF
jgi:hypothetical protein